MYEKYSILTFHKFDTEADNQDSFVDCTKFNVNNTCHGAADTTYYVKSMTVCRY